VGLVPGFVTGSDWDLAQRFLSFRRLSEGPWRVDDQAVGAHLADRAFDVEVYQGGLTDLLRGSWRGRHRRARVNTPGQRGHGGLFGHRTAKQPLPPSTARRYLCRGHPASSAAPA